MAQFESVIGVKSYFIHTTTKGHYLQDYYFQLSAMQTNVMVPKQLKWKVVNNVNWKNDLRLGYLLKNYPTQIEPGHSLSMGLHSKIYKVCYYCWEISKFNPGYPFKFMDKNFLCTLSIIADTH